mgnify:CR=1 FL=1
MALVEVLATTPSYACVHLSGPVQGPVVEGYYTKGIKPLDATDVVFVNLTGHRIQIDNLVFESSRAYDFRTKVCMQNTRQGGSISIPPHPHAHWKTRLSNFVDLSLAESAVLHVAFIDKPPSDEMGLSAPVNVDALVSDPKKKLVVIQDDAYYICRGPEGLKKSRLDFDLFASTLVSNKEAIFDISPTGTMSTPLTYANILFGSFKPPPAQVGSTFDLTLLLPGITSNGASGFVEHNDVVQSVSFGANKSSLILKLCVPHNPEKKWEVLLIVPTSADDDLSGWTDCDPTQIVGVADLRSSRHAEIVDKIVEVHRFKAEDDKVNLVKSVFEMMLDKEMNATCKSHVLMHTLWNKAIQNGTFEWQQAQSQLTIPCLPRRGVEFASNALRMHSVPNQP